SSAVGTRNGSWGTWAFTCQPAAMVTSTTASAGSAASGARTTSSPPRARPAASRASTTAAAARPVDARLNAGCGASPHAAPTRAQRGLARGRKRHVLDDLEAVARKAHQPERGVGEPADLADADVAQDLRADAELPERARPRQPRVAGAGRRAGCRPGGHEVEAVGPAEIEDHAAALGRDARHGAVEEAAGVAVAVAEDVPREILDVRSHQHRLLGPDVALHQHEVLRVVDVGRVDERAE